MYKSLYSYRFVIFLTCQLSTLFGSLFFPDEFFNETLLPLLFLINIAAGILMISKWKKLMWFFILLFAIASIMFGTDLLSRQTSELSLSRLSIYFVFNIVITWNIIQQIWQEEIIDKNVIFGLMSGYISLGFLAFFLFMSIELAHPGSLKGFSEVTPDTLLKADAIMYYAFITFMAIGYGDIVPTINMAQKAAILVGLVGQFYIIIVTGIVVGKYIQNTKEKKS
jgi:hypothetical protein